MGPSKQRYSAVHYGAPRGPAKNQRTHGPMVMGRPRWYQGFFSKKTRKSSKGKTNKWWVCGTLLVLFSIVGLCIWVMLASVANDGLYIVQVRSDRTDVNVSFRLGYFGSCVSANGAQVNQTTCIERSKYHDDKEDSLAMQYLEALGLDSTQETSNIPGQTQSSTETDVPQSIKDTIKDQLLLLMPVMINIQDQIFPKIPSVIFLTVFFLSSFSLIIMSATSFKSRASKIMLCILVILNGYSQTLGWMVAYATRQACAALLLQPQTQALAQQTDDSSSSFTDIEAFDDSAEAVLIIGTSADGLAANEIYFVQQNFTLQAVQWAIVGLACLVQILMAVLFIKRRAAAKAKARQHH